MTYGNFEIATAGETIIRALTEEDAEREAAQVAALHRVTVYVGDNRKPGEGIVTFAQITEEGESCILRMQTNPLSQTRLPIPPAPRWGFVPCPILAPVIKAEEEAAREARQSEIAKARTNFAALVAAGVICTPDDEYDRAMAYDYEQRLVKGTGRRAAAWEMHAMTREMNVLRAASHVIANGETRAEEGTRWEAARKAAPRGVRANGVGCTHRKARSNNGVASCWECGTSWVFAERPAVPTEEARKTHDLLRSVEAWLLGSPHVPHAAERAAWVRFACETFGAYEEKQRELHEAMRRIEDRLYGARSSVILMA